MSEMHLAATLSSRSGCNEPCKHLLQWSLVTVRRAHPADHRVLFEFIQHSEENKSLCARESLLQRVQQLVAWHQIQECMQPTFGFDCLADPLILRLDLQCSLALNPEFNFVVIDQHSGYGVVHLGVRVRAYQIHRANVRLRNPILELTCAHQCQPYAVYLKHMRYLGLMSLWLAIQRGTQMEGPKTLQRMEAGAGNSIEHIHSTWEEPACAPSLYRPCGEPAN